MAVITISREIGSGARFIGLKLAEALGCTCVDKEIIHEIARKMGKNNEELADFDQESYNRIGVFFQEALASIAKGGRVFHPFGIGPLDWEGVDLFTPYPVTDFQEEEYLHVLKTVVKELAAKDNTIIFGRGGSQILRAAPKAFHLRIVGHREDRVKRIIEEQQVDQTKAESVLDQRDEAARKFVFDFFDVDWADPHLYHLTLNTSLILPEAAVEIAVAAIRKVTGQG